MSNKCKISIVGDMATVEGRERLTKAEEMLLKNSQELELISLREELTPFFKNPRQDYDWIGEYLEYFRNAIQRVDRLVLLADEPSVSLGWITGYAWAWGKPVILVVPKPLNKAGIMLIDSITATVKDIDDLKEYDFAGLPHVNRGEPITAN